MRILQAAVAECLKQTVAEGAYARMLNVMNGRYVFFEKYVTQYVDILNDRFIRMNSEKRLKNISTIAKRIAERGQEYRDLELEIKEEAREHNCRVDDLRCDLDYPEDIEW